MSWKNKRVFVTGANGFLGSHLTKNLVKRGANVFALIYEPNKGSIFEEENLSKKVTVINGNVCNMSLMRKTLLDNKIEVVFHLAAQPADIYILHGL